jgi:hypothetical protein
MGLKRPAVERKLEDTTSCGSCPLRAVIASAQIWCVGVLASLSTCRGPANKELHLCRFWVLAQHLGSDMHFSDHLQLHLPCGCSAIVSSAVQQVLPPAGSLWGVGEYVTWTWCVSGVWCVSVFNFLLGFA